MTKKYIVTKDQIQSTVTTSEFPASSTAVKTELDTKVAISQGVAEAGKYLKVGSDGNLAPAAIDAQVKANWTETDTTAAAYIQNKPFKTIGTGLSVVSDALTADTQFKFQIFETLPTASADYAQTIALIANSGSGTNVYDEYGCVKVGNAWSWERFGTTDFQLSISQTAAGISINSTALQAGSASQTGLITSTDWSTFNGKQDAIAAGTSGNVLTYSGTAGTVGSLAVDSAATASSANLITSGAVKTGLDAKQDTIAAGTSGNVVTYSGTAGTVGSLGVDTAATASSANLITSGAVKTGLDAKVDKVEGTVAIGKDSTGYYFNESD